MSRKRNVVVHIVLLALVSGFSNITYAHLMQDQHGTINIIGDTAFLVLSIPVTAFNDMDDDQNGTVSMIEFNKHRADIVKSVREHLVMSDRDSDYLLQGILLSPAISDINSSTLAPHITVMGRFALPKSRSDLRVRMGLFGEKKAEQTFEVSVKDKLNHQSNRITLTKKAAVSAIF